MAQRPADKSNARTRAALATGQCFFGWLAICFLVSSYAHFLAINSIFNSHGSWKRDPRFTGPGDYMPCLFYTNACIYLQPRLGAGSYGTIGLATTMDNTTLVEKNWGWNASELSPHVLKEIAAWLQDPDHPNVVRWESVEMREAMEV
jgi:hypothetical protein